MSDPGPADAPAGTPTPEAAAADAERRLHPMSWLFVLLQQLKQFIVPLLALVLFGGGDSDDIGYGYGGEFWPLIGVGALAIVSVWQYFTYRYGVSGDALVVRSGLFERSVRVIPFARIHNVALQQSLLHRLVGVAEVRLESAGGTKPEAEMRVLKLEDALALESLVRHRGAAAPATATAGPVAAPLLALDTGEVLRHGLVSNRGMLLVAAAFGGMWQVPGLRENLFEGWGESAFGWAEGRQFGPAEYVLAGASLLLLAVVAVRLLSMLVALLQYHGFELREHGRRLTVERGLLARWRTSASRRRIQAWTLEEGVLHRLLKRRSLAVDTAVAEEQQNQQRALRELAPIATPQACDALIRHLLPGARWDTLAWQLQPASNWWRIWWPGAVIAVSIAAAASVRAGAWALLVLLWLPWSAFTAWQHARRLAWSVNDALVAVRGGWWSRHWRFAEVDKLQALQLTRNAVDRRFGTASLSFDTAGAGALAPPLRIRFLPEAVARELQDRLAATLARRPLRW